MNKVGSKISRLRRQRESRNIYWSMKNSKQKPHNHSRSSYVLQVKTFPFFHWKVFFYCYIHLWYLYEFIFMNLILDSFMILCSGHVWMGKKFWRCFILLSENWSNWEKISRQQKHKPPSFPIFFLAVVYITLYYIYTTIILGILLWSANFI